MERGAGITRGDRGVVPQAKEANRETQKTIEMLGQAVARVEKNLGLIDRARQCLTVQNRLIIQFKLHHFIPKDQIWRISRLWLVILFKPVMWRMEVWLIMVQLLCEANNTTDSQFKKNLYHKLRLKISDRCMSSRFQIRRSLMISKGISLRAALIWYQL